MTPCYMLIYGFERHLKFCTDCVLAVDFNDFDHLVDLNDFDHLKE